MPEVVAVEHLSLGLGAFALRSVDLALREDEYAVLLGPTGAGKTVLLECVVGLNRPERGRVRVRGRDVTDLPPEAREVGYVPQDYALFPTMTVTDNVAYGPRAHRWPARDVERRVAEVLARFELQSLAGRWPGSLSGGERQRVAVARALAVRPAVLLLDEPLAALDESRRAELTAGLVRLRREVGGTFLHVCHNLDEAAEVADRVAVMADGAVVQVGTFEDVVHRPASAFVARFTGCTNLFRASPAGPAAVMLADGTVLQTVGVPAAAGALAAVRPELIEVASGGAGEGATALEGVVVARAARAAWFELRVEVLAGGLAWTVRVPRRNDEAPPAPGERVRFRVPRSAVHLLPEAQESAAKA